MNYFLVRGYAFVSLCLLSLHVVLYQPAAYNQSSTIRIGTADVPLSVILADLEYWQSSFYDESVEAFEQMTKIGKWFNIRI